MLEQQFKIAEIEVAKSPTDEKILGIFRFEGGTNKKTGNKILILAEVHSILYAYERLLDVINAAVDQTRHLIIDVEQDPVARFEKLIQRVNERVHDFLAGEPTPISWNRVNIFILELSQNHICLTGRGRLMNVFLQKQEDATYRTFDLFGSLEQPVEVDPAKPFASIICGDIKNGDVLIAGSTNLERLRNELRIKERLTSLPAVSAALEIKGDLEKRGIPDDFVAMVVACCDLEKPGAPSLQPVTVSKEKSTESIRKLRQAEKEAEEHLSPTLGPAKVGGKKIEQTKKIVAGLMGLLRGAKDRVKNLRRRDVALLTNLRGMSAGYGSVLDGKGQRNLKIAGVVLLILIISFGIWNRSQRLATEAAVWDATFQAAQDNRNRAESDLIYGNDSRAKKELDRATELLAGLDLKKEDNKERVLTLQEDLEKLHEKLRKIQALGEVKTLIALEGVAAGTLTAPVLTESAAYAVDNGAKKVVKVNLASGEIQKIALPDEAETIVSGSAGKTSIVFTTAKGRLYGVDKSSGSVSTLSSEANTEATTDLVIYANRAYTLDATNGQVWRASAVSNGFGSPQGYIKASDVSLIGAVSLAIDSNLYVLKTDGSVSKFFSGGQEAFKLADIDPPLRAASAIWTEADSDKLVISDPAEKRILIFNKDGTLRAQLVTDQLAGPRDITSDESGKNLLIIDGTRLLLIALP